MLVVSSTNRFIAIPDLLPTVKRYHAASKTCILNDRLDAGVALFVHLGLHGGRSFRIHQIYQGIFVIFYYDSNI